MFKKILFVFLAAMEVHSTPAQSHDREKITDFFQNQQFEEAIAYLNPIHNKDTANLQVLFYLGYAHYMNEDKERDGFYFEKILRTDYYRTLLLSAGR